MSDKREGEYERSFSETPKLITIMESSPSSTPYSLLNSTPPPHLEITSSNNRVTQRNQHLLLTCNENQRESDVIKYSTWKIKAWMEKFAVKVILTGNKIDETKDEELVRKKKCPFLWWGGWGGERRGKNWEVSRKTRQTKGRKLLINFPKKNSQ